MLVCRTQLRDWEAVGYLSERPFFWLRLVFILLCLKDVETAEKVLLQGGTGQDWDSAEVRTNAMSSLVLAVRTEAIESSARKSVPHSPVGRVFVLNGWECRVEVKRGAVS